MKRITDNLGLKGATAVLVVAVSAAFGAGTVPNIMSEAGGTAAFPKLTGVPSPDQAAVLADNPAMPGIFTGNYIAAGVLGVGVRIRTDVLPSECTLYFYSRVNDREWDYPINSLSSDSNEWVTVIVPFNLQAGWVMWDSGATEEKFIADLQSVDQIGVRVMRRGTTAQTTDVTDFMLLGGSSFASGSALYTFMFDNALNDSGADNDHDGLSNWGEFLAMSDPNDDNSGFVLRIEREPDTNGVILKWSHVPGRRFAIWRSSSLASGFTRITPMGAERVSTDPQNMERVDEDGVQNYYYKIEILE